MLAEKCMCFAFYTNTKMSGGARKRIKADAEEVNEAAEAAKMAQGVTPMR